MIRKAIQADRTIGPGQEHCCGSEDLWTRQFCAAVRSHDAFALSQLCEALLPELTARAHAILGRRWGAGVAEAVACGGLMKAFRSGSSFDCSRPLRPWLAAAVRTEAIDFLRWHRGMKATVLSALGNEGPWDVADPLGVTPLEALAEREREHESAENRRRMFSAIENLPPVEKLIVTFRLSGLGNQEIARRLDMRSGHVALVFHQAKKRLREDLLGSRR